MQRLEKAPHVKHYFILFTFINRKRKKKMKKKRKNIFNKKCLHNERYSMNIRRLFCLFYRLFSHTFLFVLTIFFDLKLPLLVFWRSRAVLQKRNNFSWWTLTFRPASPQTEGKLNLYLRFPPLKKKKKKNQKDSKSERMILKTKLNCGSETVWLEFSLNED